MHFPIEAPLFFIHLSSRYPSRPPISKFASRTAIEIRRIPLDQRKTPSSTTLVRNNLSSGRRDGNAWSPGRRSVNETIPRPLYPLRGVSPRRQPLQLFHSIGVFLFCREGGYPLDAVRRLCLNGSTTSWHFIILARGSLSVTRGGGARHTLRLATVRGSSGMASRCCYMFENCSSSDMKFNSSPLFLKRARNYFCDADYVRQIFPLLCQLFLCLPNIT